MKVKVKRWHGVAVWKWEIVDEDVSQIVDFVILTKSIVADAVAFTVNKRLLTILLTIIVC